jgi:hypothetical protein
MRRTRSEELARNGLVWRESRQGAQLPQDPRQQLPQDPRLPLASGHPFPRPVIPMGLTPEHALVPHLRPLPQDMARELFEDVVTDRRAALLLAASPLCIAVGLGFPRRPAPAPARPRSAGSPAPTTTVTALPEYPEWDIAPASDSDDPADPGPAVTVQVLYSQFPYLHPDPAARMVWPWGAEGEGWRDMSVSFRHWIAAHAEHVFRATGCVELHLWVYDQASPPWKAVIPEQPHLPVRIEA